MESDTGEKLRRNGEKLVLLFSSAYDAYSFFLCVSLFANHRAGFYAVWCDLSAQQKPGDRCIAMIGGSRHVLLLFSLFCEHLISLLFLLFRNNFSAAYLLTSPPPHFEALCARHVVPSRSMRPFLIAFLFESRFYNSKICMSHLLHMSNM